MIKRFMDLFNGLDRAHGVYTLPAGAVETAGKKVKGKAKTVQERVTADLWDKHLSGRQGLGIVPIRDDSTVMFAAIDIDEYKDLDYAVIDKRIKKAHLPLVMCRTKSGGLHLYMFTTQPISAEVVRDKMIEWCEYLGYPGIEVFPKQIRMASKNDVGNWINMPYFNGARTTRYALRNAQPLTSIPAFLDYAEAMRISESDLRAVTVPENADLPGAPPCLRKLASTGFPAGSLNNSLFSLAVYARKAYPDDWENKVYEYNQAYLGPGTPAEVAQVINGVRKHDDYFYKCKDTPLCSVCDKSACIKSEHGISKTPPLKIASLSKYDAEDPLWYLTIEGESIELTTEQFSSQTLFSRAIMARLNKKPPMLKPFEWDDYINDALSKVVIIEAPEEAGPAGQFKIHLQSFFNEYHSPNREDILAGRVWWDEATSTCKFRANDLIKYLSSIRFTDMQQSRIWSIMSFMGATNDTINIMGIHTPLWCVPQQGERAQPQLTVVDVDDVKF